MKQYTMEELKSEVVKKLKEDEDIVIIEKENDSLEIKMKGDDKFQSGLYLGNMLKEVNNGADVNECIKRRLDIFATMKDAKQFESNISSWDFVKDKVLFVPQHKDYGQNMIDSVPKMKDKSEKEESKILTKPFINDIVLMGVVDFPGHMAYLTKAIWSKWGKTKEEIEDQMGKNLLLFETKHIVHKIDGMVHIRPKGEGVLSTFLIQPKKLRNIADENGLKDKDIVGTIPFRDLIVLTEASTENIMKVWSLSQSMITDKFMPYSISEKPFRIDKDGVVGQVRMDDAPGTGVMLAMDPKTGSFSMLPIGTKDNPDPGPQTEEMVKELMKKDKGLLAGMVMMKSMVEGFPADDFIRFMKEREKDTEEIKWMLKELSDQGILKPKKVNGEWRLFPNPKLIEKFFGMFEK